jgi:cobalt-zinc-cadmium efflux system outer membrane protein
MTIPHDVRIAIGFAAAVWGLVATTLGAQQGAIDRVTRQQAIDAALARGARIAVARADTFAAAAQVRSARMVPNPAFSAGYSKSTPQYHLSLEQPVDPPWIRRPRVASAEFKRSAARYRFVFERASIVFDAETTYTGALAAAARAELSRRNAVDADSLLRMATVRRDAGDASELDVQLAIVFAGQQANLAAADSLRLAGALLDLQAVMGLPAATVRISLADSLTLLPNDSVAALGVTPLTVLAAEETMRSAESMLTLERRNVFSSLSLTAGFETRDPSGAETGILPTVGFSAPFPLFNRNDGAIAVAAAELDLARAELALARLAAGTKLARASRDRDVALSRVARDRRLVVSADRVAAMSLTAYAEGASALPNVIEARRTARESLAQYVDDLAAANVAIAAVRWLTRSARIE